MVGLAMAALLGGLLIVLSRLVPDAPDQTSRATATPAVTATAAASATPRPSVRPPPGRTMTVDPAPIEPWPDNRPTQAAEWVRLRTPVTLLSSPTSAAQPSGRLRRGDAAFVTEVPPEGAQGASGWLTVDGPVSGWIFGEIDNPAMFERFPHHGSLSSGIYGLTPDPTGFTAIGWLDDRELTLTSPDGTHWQEADAPRTSYGRSIANGPAGWLMASTVVTESGAPTVIWASTDARSWEPQGTLPEDLLNGFQRVAGSDAGYVMVDYGPAGTGRVWYSADGLLWAERPIPRLLPDLGLGLVATSSGFFIWGLGDPSAETPGAFSSDGWTWSEATFPGAGQVTDVVADGDRLLAMGRGPDGPLLWAGAVDGQQLTWSGESALPFRTAGVSRMVSDGERVVALGWDRASESLLWWQRVGQTWEEHRMPADVGGIPTDVAGGPMGIVLVGEAYHAGGSQPVIWHLGPGEDTWRPEPDPVMPAPPDPSPQRCGPLPDDLLGLLNGDPSWAAACFGDASITVRGWSVACPGCYARALGTWDEEWLAQPANGRVIHLSPSESVDWGTTDGVLHPSVRSRPPVSRWLEVTGHFDDPHAAGCHWTPIAADELQFSGTWDIVTRCRSQFVVTDVHPVSGP